MQKTTSTLLLSISLSFLSSELCAMKRGGQALESKDTKRVRYSTEVLKEAIDQEDKSRIRECIDNGVTIDCTFTGSGTPLLYAIKQNKEDIALYLVSLGADIERSFDNTNPLMEAACKGHKHLVRLLLDKGADPHIKYLRMTRVSALIGAVGAGDIEIVTMLLDKGVDINVHDSAPLRAAAYRGNINMIQFLLKHGATMNTTVLAAAVRGNKVAVVEFCLKHGVKVSHIGDEPPLFVAVYNKFREIVSVLLSASTSLPKGYKSSVVVAALETNQLDLIPQLLERGGLKGADPYAHYQCLKIISNKRSQALYKVFQPYMKDIDINARFSEKSNWRLKNTWGGKTFLIKAIEEHDGLLIRALLTLGADPKARDTKGRSVLWYAVEAGNVPLMDYLKRFYNLSIACDENTALVTTAIDYYQLSYIKKLSCIKKLFDFGLAVSEKDKALLLHRAVEKGFLSIVKFFLSLNWDVDNVTKASLLCCAVEKNFFSIVEFFLNLGWDVNNRTEDDQNCLVKAIVKGNVLMIQQLVQAGAKVDKEGWLAQWATESESPETLCAMFLLFPNLIHKGIDQARVSLDLRIQGLSYYEHSRRDDLRAMSHLLALYQSSYGFDYYRDPQKFFDTLKEKQLTFTVCLQEPKLTLLILAALFGHENIVKQIITEPELTATYINFQDAYGCNAVEYALTYGHINIACALINSYVHKKQDADVPLKLGKFEGDRAFNYAITKRSLPLVSALLSLGRVPTLEHVGYAKLLGCFEIMVVLAAKVINADNTQTIDNSYLVGLARVFKA